MKNKVLKFFRNFAIFLVVFGVLFSNIPFYALTNLIDSYEKTSGIVDKIWLLEQNHGNDIVDNFSSVKNFAKKLEIPKAMAAINIRNVGAYVNGTANLTPVIPATAAAGDMMILAYGTKPYNDAPTITAGWNLIGSATDGTVAAGIDVGSMQTRIYYKEHTGSETNPTVTNGTNNVSGAVIIAFQKGASEVWDIPVGAGGGDATAGTGFSVTASSNPGITVGDMLVGYAAIRSDAGTQSAIGITATGATMGTFTESPASDLVTTAGGDMAMSGGYRSVTAGTASAAPVYASTLAASHTGSAFIVRLRATTPADSTPPTPSPMTFATAPNNTSATQIDMTATTATDATTPPVSYYFALDTTVCTAANIGTGAADSGWQSGTTYSDIGLAVNKCYGYKVKARDSVGTPNETGLSGITTLYTSANTPSAPTVGSPTETTLVITNNENGNPLSNPVTYFAVQVTTADANWNGKWVNASGASSATAVWLTDTQLTNLTVTGLTGSTLYDFNVKARNEDLDETGLSTAGSGTTSAPATTLTISASAGSKVATKNSGDVDQYAHNTACTGATDCAAFTLTAAGGTVNVTSIKITESGTATANTELSDANLYYDTDGSWSDAGAETLFGTTATFAADQTATISGTLAISAGATAYIYVRYDLANGAVYPIGGATVNFQIAAAADVVSDGTESGSGTLAGTQTVLPNVTSITYPITSPLNGSRIGQSITVNGAGFGATCDGTNNRITIGGVGNVVSCTGTTFSSTSISITNFQYSSGDSYGGAATLLVRVGATDDNASQDMYVYPDVTDVTNPTAYTNAAREYSASDSDGVITINGNHFGTAQGSGSVTVLGQTAGIVSWGATAIQIQIPTTIGDGAGGAADYQGNIISYQGTGGNSSASDTYGGGTYRILPRIISTGPVNLKGGQSQSGVSITGNHLCQDASCVGSPEGTEDITFNAVSGKTGSTWGHTSITTITVPATATDGNLILTSDGDGAGTFTSNALNYNVKFGPSAPTGSSAGGSNNPTLSGTAFSDGTDGDTHYKTTWQIAHNSDVDWNTPEWSRITTTGLTSAAVNTTDSGAFANGDAGQTELDCGTTYKGRVMYMDNGNGGADTQTWEWSSYSSNYTFTTGSCNNLTVGATGTQTANITRGINTNYLGGSFTLTTNTSAATITSVKISETGNITANNNLNNVKLYYDTDGTWSGTFTETQLGTTQTTFSASEDVTFSSLSLGVNNTTTTYVYVVVDIDADPTSGQLIDIQITNPSTDVAVTSASNSDAVAKAITGSTTVANPNVNVASAGTQTANMSRGSTAQYVGGSFTLTMASATGTLTSFAITDNGTVVANTNLNNVKLYYDTDGTWSGTFTETQLGTTQTFDASEKATFGALSLGLTTSATYIYVVLDVNSAATAGQTIEIRVAASGDVVGTGFNTSGTFPLDISGATTIADPSLTVGVNGTQTANLNSGATAQNIGGSFTFVLTGATGTLNSFVISEMGTVGATANLTNVKLQSDTDGTYPGTDVTGCTALSFNASQQISCTPTGGLSLSTTARYVYVIVDLGSGATGGETIEAQITNPSTDVSVTGASNTDTGAKAITGTTTILPNVTSITYPITSPLNGARIGQSITINGAGFGATCDGVNNKVTIGGASNVVSCTGTTFSSTSISITNFQYSSGDSYGGAASLLVRIGATDDDASQDMYVYPDITDVTNPTAYTNAAREYNAADSDGVITINGNHFGTSQGSGSVTVLGQTASIVSWGATAIQIQIPTTIGDGAGGASDYQGSIIVYQGTGGNSSALDTYGGGTYRILPRILSFNPSNPAIGDAVEIIGNHLCQAGAASCPTILDADNKVTFTSGVDAIVKNTWVNGDSSTVGVNVQVPVGAVTGNVVVKSNTYDSNSLSITLASNIPNNPTTLGQFRNAAYTDPIATGGSASSATIYFQMTMQASLSGGTLYPQIEAKAIGTAFTCIGTGVCASASEGTGQAGPGPATGQVSAALTTNTQYHWQARVKHNKGGNDYYSDWVSYPTPTPNNEADTDFYIDTSGPTISSNCPLHSSVTSSGAVVQWNLSDNFSTTFTKQVQYDTASAFTSSSCTPGSTCGSPTSGYSAGTQSVTLSNLSPNTAYYYRARSKDLVGNETIKGYGLSGDTSCTFTTAQAETRTTEFYITTKTGTLSQADGEYTPSFTVYIPESSYSIKSAFVEMSGIFSTDASPPSDITLRVNSQAGISYTVGTSATAVTPFSVIHNIPEANLNIATPSNPSATNTLGVIVVDSGTSVSVVSAKIVVTYYHTPVQ